MPHYGALSESGYHPDADDLRGAEVYGVNDEKLGTIGDVIFDHASGDIRYVVVETGGLFTKKSFLVPANRVSLYGSHEDKFYSDLDKERIQMLPEYNEKALKSEAEWQKYEKHYENQWNGGALMYNTSTGRIVTPPTEQVSGTQVTDIHQEGRASLPRLIEVVEVDDEMLRKHESDLENAADNDDSIGKILSEKLRAAEPAIYRVDADVDAEEQSGLSEPLHANYGPRWNKFQTRLRERREDAVSECPICGRQKKVA